MRAWIDSIDTRTLIGKRNKALFTTLALSGLRVYELAMLTQQQIVKRENGYLLHLYAEESKNQEEDREANISVEEVRAIEAWLAARPFQAEHIFTAFGGRGERLLRKPITTRSAWHVVKEVTERQGLENIKPHDFRRFVGTQLAKGDIRKAQKALGHKRIDTTVKYDLSEIDVGATDHLC